MAGGIQWVWGGNFLVASVAFLFGYFTVLKDFIPGGVGTAAEIFVGTFVGSWIANQFTPDVKQSTGQIAVLGGMGVLGALLGLIIAYALNGNRVMWASTVGALFVFWWGSRLAPFKGLSGFLGTSAPTRPLGTPPPPPGIVGYTLVGASTYQRCQGGTGL